MSTHPLQRLEPADNPLLTLIFDRVDDSMLLEIAKNDLYTSLERLFGFDRGYHGTFYKSFDPTQLDCAII
jgi:hypothetical protein